MVARTKAKRKKDDGWRKASRQGPLWSANAGRKMLLDRMGSPSGGRIFDGNGLLQNGALREALNGSAEQVFSQIAGSDLFRVSSPIADREESDRPFEENVWVRAAVKAVAEGFQRLAFRVYPKDPDEGVDALDTHPLLTMLARPNRIMTGRSFWRANAVNMKHDGECIWFLMNGKGEPVKADEETRVLSELPVTVLPVRGDLVEVQYDKQGLPCKYRYTTSYSARDHRVSQEFTAGSVVHFRDFDPYNIARGLGDVSALERETDLYFQAFRAMDASVRNGGDPGGFIIYDHEVDVAEMQRRQDQADEDFSGPNQRRIKLLQSSAKYVPNGTKPSDMQYQQLLTWLRDSILAGIGVSPPIVGVYDSATYNNVETAHREMYTGPNGILALAAATADTITEDLLPRLARFGSKEGEVATFDHSHIEVLQTDVSDRITLAADVAAKGVGVSFNEVLEMQGTEVEQPEEGDRRWVGGTLKTIEDYDNPPEPVDVPTGDESGGESKDEPEDDSEKASIGANGIEFEFAIVDIKSEEEEFDSTIRGRVESWMASYEREQIALLRRISNNGLRRFNILDENVNPESLTDEAWEALLLEEEPWAEKLGNRVRVALREVFAFAISEAAGEVESPLVSMTDPKVIEALATQRIKMSEGVTSTVVRRVRNAIAAVLADVHGAGSLRDQIKAALPQLTEEMRRIFGSKESRAATIAQTEMGKARSTARFTQYEASGVTKIQWIASQDEATRATHAAIHGDIISLGGRFDNGLRRPHDPEGGASEVINCRCTYRVAERRDPLDDPDIEIS